MADNGTGLYCKSHSRVRHGRRRGQTKRVLNKERKVKIDVEVTQDSAKKLTSNIEKGIKSTRIDTSSISKRLADSFNISDKGVIRKLQSQINSMISSLVKLGTAKILILEMLKDSIPAWKILRRP